MDKGELIEKIRKVPGYIWVLTAIVLFGIFLRTYNFHQWLNFRDDQVRDASLVSQISKGEKPWPVMGPYMSYTGEGDHVEANSFHLGPIYYYFQIISVKIFGDYADRLAYPDVLFGILSIILLYLFLRIYFERNLSLGLAGIYAISPYFIQYSRFAWNTNLIPFFVLLFLFSLYKFLEKNEKANWRWVILLGIAMGVGVQLHVIIIAIFLPVAFIVFVISLKKNVGAWKKWALVLLIICILNTSQIVSELKTGFGNTKILFYSASHRSNTSTSKLALIKNDIDCNVEVNAYFLSSYGISNCSYSFLTPSTYGQISTRNLPKFISDLKDVFVMLVAVVFSILGYFLLIRYGKNETGERKKIFLRLLVLYVVVAFFVMIPLSVDKFKDFRYLTPVFFVPFVLLGFIVKFVREKINNKYLLFAVIGTIFLFLAYTNGMPVFDRASALQKGKGTCTSNSATLGELEPVAEHMISNSGGKSRIYFEGDKGLKVAYLPLEYLLKRRGVDVVKIDSTVDLSQKKFPAYIISCRSSLKESYPYGEVGDIYVFQLNK